MGVWDKVKEEEAQQAEAQQQTARRLNVSPEAFAEVAKDVAALREDMNRVLDLIEGDGAAPIEAEGEQVDFDALVAASPVVQELTATIGELRAFIAEHVKPAETAKDATKAKA
jgi:hypothetical protein